jgi:two-component system OmpR family response regulator
VTKPFSLEELIARLRNILRRTGVLSEVPSRLTFADLELDEDTLEVSRAGQLLELTATEFRLLCYLMLNPRRVLTRGQLLDHVWSYDFGGDARVLETYICYLRKKMDVGGPPLVQTVRGVGYALRLPKS